jgi:hypothetical protein
MDMIIFPFSFFVGAGLCAGPKAATWGRPYIKSVFSLHLWLPAQVTQVQVIDVDSLARPPTFAFNLTAHRRKSSEKSNAHVGPRFAKYVGIEQAIQVLYGLENPASTYL